MRPELLSWEMVDSVNAERTPDLRAKNKTGRYAQIHMSKLPTQDDCRKNFCIVILVVIP